MPTRTIASPDKLAKACGWVGVVTLVLALGTMKAGDLRTRRPLPEGVKSAMLALELIRTPAVLDQIARPDESGENLPAGITARRERAQLARAIKVDFAFIGAYATFLTLMGLFGLYTLPSRLSALGLIVVCTAIGAAAFDIRENLAMLALLGHSLSAHPRSASLVKWALLFTAVAGGAPVFIDGQATMFRRTLGFVGIALALWAAGEGWFGVWKGDDRMIETSATRLGQTFLLAVIFFLTRHPFREGVLPALNRLAKWGPFTWVTDWPSKDQNGTVEPSVFDPPPK